MTDAAMAFASVVARREVVAETRTVQSMVLADEAVGERRPVRERDRRERRGRSSSPGGRTNEENVTFSPERMVFAPMAEIVAFESGITCSISTSMSTGELSSGPPCTRSR